MRSKDLLCRYGPERLSDNELWEIVLGSTQAAEAVAQYVPGLDSVALNELQDFPQVGSARAEKVAAVFELGRRMTSYAIPETEKVYIPEDIFKLLRGQLMGLRQEKFFSIALDTKNRVNRIFEIGSGGLGGVEVHPREVFRPLIREAAASVILAHNHPSGDPTPSAEDKVLTRRIKEVGELVGIKLLDHIIVGNPSYISFAEMGWS